ncbi:hypothetical protein AAT19DRAFT_16847 [Rhodotorula toruloides]|uniref:BTB domain-containing protein n=1 Tax=Rhodotorula toruloides TaxID=5286 RepID=A0A2T0A4K0_RHOTO|nr:hypothetical protein AAT19DRAFT_16847 [Rhodotorula toruloides]
MTATPTTPARQKREASTESEQASLGGVSKRLKRMSVGGGMSEAADVVLVSSDGQRFPISSRLIPSTVLLSSSTSTALVFMSDTGSDALPEVALSFTAATLEYVLQFLENRPVVVRELEFPRDWETMRALSDLSIWRGIDSFQTSLSKQPLDPSLLAPAFCFALHFSYPSSVRQIALAIAKHCHADPEAVTELTKGLMEGARELKFGAEKLGRLFELVSPNLAPLRLQFSQLTPADHLAPRARDALSRHAQCRPLDPHRLRRLLRLRALLPRRRVDVFRSSFHNHEQAQAAEDERGGPDVRL